MLAKTGLPWTWRAYSISTRPEHRLPRSPTISAARSKRFPRDGETGRNRCAIRAARFNAIADSLSRSAAARNFFTLSRPPKAHGSTAAWLASGGSLYWSLEVPRGPAAATPNQNNSDRYKPPWPLRPRKPEAHRRQLWFLPPDKGESDRPRQRNVLCVLLIPRQWQAIRLDRHAAHQRVGGASILSIAGFPTQIGTKGSGVPLFGRPASTDE
jgi:hypothetical protein